MIPIDEQIAGLKIARASCVSHGLNPCQIDAILASLERLKAIDAVQVPEEPERIVVQIERRIKPKITVVEAHHYDTLRDLLKRETAEKEQNWAANCKQVEWITDLQNDIKKLQDELADEQKRILAHAKRALKAEATISAMLKLGAEPSEEMKALARTALKISSIKSDADAAALFSFMFAKLAEQAGVKK